MLDVFVSVNVWSHALEASVSGRGCDEADISEEKRFSLKEGEAFSE